MWGVTCIVNEQKRIWETYQNRFSGQSLDAFIHTQAHK